MGFNKIRLGQEEIFTLIIQEQDGRNIGKWVSMKRDFVNNTLKIVDKQFGLNIWKKQKEKEKDKDLDWALG